MWQTLFRKGDEIEVLPQCADLMFTPQSRKITASDGEISNVVNNPIIYLHSVN